MSDKFYITTAIDYTNDIVHVGHSYQKVLADALARYHRLIGNRTHFLTGTDEHGQKVEQSAKKSKENPKDFVDKIAAADREEWDKLNISYDRFFRTTDEDHVKFAQEIYMKSKAVGDIYMGRFDGLYCEGCEGYLEESELIEGKCPYHPAKDPQRVTEKNYFFRLSKYQKFIENHIESHPEFVWPDAKRAEVLAFVKRGLRDFSVSRPNVSWGIPVPDDPSHTIYVWFDALINYLTYGVEENCWPASVHVLGKDNLRFHAVYWPAMLKSAGYALPKTILAHDFISLNGRKISKSLGNVIGVSELVDKFGTDGVRYFFLRHGPLTNDVDITLKKIEETYNADLANGLGNLVARVARLCELSEISAGKPEASGFDEFVVKSLESFRVDNALSSIWDRIKAKDKQIEFQKLWENTKEKAQAVADIVREVRQIACNLQPFLPETAEKILKQFAGPKIRAEAPLFPRLGNY